MKTKRSVTMLLCSFLLVTILLVSILVLMLQTGKIYKRTASIILPNQGGFVEAWVQHLPQIARTIGIPEITILTYDNFEKLKSYFLSPEKYNILFAEIPISGDYNLKKLLSNISLSTVDKSTLDYYPPALYKTIQSYIETTDTNFLPLSYNPWLVVKKSNNKEIPTFEYSAGAYYNDVAFATLLFARKMDKTENKILTIEEGLSNLKEMVDDKTFITNPRTYTNKDAYSALENNKVKKTILPIYFFNNLPVSQRLELSIEPFSAGLITDATVAIFPNRKSEESKLAVNKAKQILTTNTELLYSIANARAWIPAHINTVSRSIYTDYIRKQARQVDICLIPQTQFNSEKEKNNLIEKLDIALKTNFFAQ